MSNVLFTDGQKSILDHNARFYADRYSTPVYEHLIELTQQDDAIYEAMWETRTWRGGGDSDLERAHEQITIMHTAVSESWQKQQAYDWNLSQGMSIEDAGKRMAR